MLAGSSPGRPWEWSELVPPSYMVNAWEGERAAVVQWPEAEHTRFAFRSSRRRAREERDEVCAAAGLLVASPAPMAQTNDQNQTKRPKSNRSRSKIARPIAASHASCGCPGGAETKIVARSYP
eukprot:scaffold8765_cov131-Isochrysis_galbana.AAC.4